MTIAKQDSTIPRASDAMGERGQSARTMLANKRDSLLSPPRAFSAAIQTSR